MKTRAKTREEIKAPRLLARIRATVRRLNIKLQPMCFILENFNGQMVCCALGAATALRAKTKEELKAFSNDFQRETWSDTARARFTARLLNHGLTADDMRNMEAGFEGWESLATDVNGPFFAVGVKLRKDAEKARR